MAALTWRNSSRRSPDARGDETTGCVADDGGVADETNGVADGDGDEGEDGADTKVGVTRRQPDLTARPYGLGVPDTSTTGGCGALLLVLDPERIAKKKHSMNKTHSCYIFWLKNKYLLNPHLAYKSLAQKSFTY
jgi:hypothetical protein